MNLKDLMPHFEFSQVWGDTNIDFVDIGVDSRMAGKGVVFIAIKGELVDANDYVQDVVESGCRIVVSENSFPKSFVGWNGAWIQVDDDRKSLSQIAEAFYEFPSQKIKLVGVTGTNGKSTVAGLLYQLFEDLGYKVGLFSTIENRIHLKVLPSKLTTPDPISLSKYLAEMVAEGCDYCFMEVSSHALSQSRTFALEFSGGVFMNITHDHLDYHHSFQNYISAKKLFFDQLSSSAFALVNKDDSKGDVMLQNCNAQSYGFGMRGFVDFKVQILEEDIEAMLLSLNQRQVYTTITGSFNAYNLASIFGVAVLLGIDEEEVLKALSGLHGVAGRMQKIKLGDQCATGIVDYAHSPDAVEKVCKTLLEMLAGKGQLIVVVGCGGNRDKAKRPVMAKIAADASGACILTSDNPRDEAPEQIIQDMVAGLNPILKAKTFSIVDRKEAIRMAVALSNHNDVILVAGKGHEKYQIIGKEILPFDDVVVLKDALKIKFIKE